ncbi:MAG: TatD family hydrolase [Candidatus Aenigmatarchaeota archaeon]
MIDTHCHLEFKQFDKDREEVVARCQEKLKAVVDSAAKASNAEKVLGIQDRYPNFVFASLGYHPTYVLDASREKLEEYKQFLRERKDEIVAIGEIGLDYAEVENEKSREKTRNRFREFVELSNELELPVVIHSRNAMADTLEILKEKEGKVIIHCFAGNIQQLKEAVDRGYYISYGGLVFRIRNKYRGLVKQTPPENILLETDAPFLGKKPSDRNEPTFVEDVAKQIADWKELEFKKVWKQAGKNAIEALELPVNI